MDNFNDYFYLGKVTKPHGYEGKVTVFFDTDEPEEYNDLEMVYLNIGGGLIPYFIEELSLLNNKAIISFMDINDSSTAEDLVNKEMYLPLSVLPKLSGNKFYYHEIKNMLVVDENFGELGPISAVLEYPNQPVLQIFHNTNEVLIPISDEVIKNVDRKQNKMIISAPEGLLDIYLNP